MTINYIHIYDLLAGGPITGVKVYTRVQGEKSSKFNEIHSLLEPDMCRGSNKLNIIVFNNMNFELFSPCTLVHTFTHYWTPHSLQVKVYKSTRGIPMISVLQMSS